jgi:hypothetical protein
MDRLSVAVHEQQDCHMLVTFPMSASFAFPNKSKQKPRSTILIICDHSGATHFDPFVKFAGQSQHPIFLLGTFFAGLCLYLGK